MPTTYTHDTFGKLIYQKLPTDVRELLMNHKNSFLIGLHGPDLLFYYHPLKKNPVSQRGQEMHQEIAAPFFEKCKEYYMETGDEEALAYVIGFICHYMLDSTCHPYIGRYMEKTGAGHDEIETELDRYFMERANKNPFRLKPAAHFKASRESTRAISAILGLPEKTVRKCIRSLRFYTGVTVGGGLKRAILLQGMRLLGVYSSLQGQIMRKKPLKRCAESTGELVSLFKLAVPETLTVIEDFYDTLEERGYLNGRFGRNYE